MDLQLAVPNNRIQMGARVAVTFLGSTRMNLGLFILLTTAGSLIWNAILVGVGAAVGSSWENIVAVMDVYSNLIYALLALGGLTLLVLFIRKRKAA